MPRSVCSAAARALVTMITITSLASCGGGVKSVFHSSDPSFRPTAGTRPPVYLEPDLADVPRVPLRSVGIIEVTVPERSGMKAAAEFAADKGRELGCWIIVEHGAFARLQLRASLPHGAWVLLAHGSINHVSPGRPRNRARQVVKFDCVLRAGNTIPAAAWARAVTCL